MPVKKSELYSTLWEACNKLRGGVEPARYKDYVLVLLFHKYVSDKYKGQRFGAFTVTDATSFDALVKLKGSKNIGEDVTKVLEQFFMDNGLAGVISVNFNNAQELGAGQELVDRVTGLIGEFEKPELDFRSNTSSGDDIIGDAYEYLMMKFAQASGKSKGQFYTPGEVSRVIARLIGIDNITPQPNHSWTLYDPACGSGSLLIRADDEAPKRSDGKSLVSIYGQEVDHSTAGLAKMNLVLHGRASADIKNGNTLSNPLHLIGPDKNKTLLQFDFVVMNPPFSDKSWSDGIDPDNDKYNRFSKFGTPPEKNGDYAWFMHVLASLNSTGKAGIVMPHGVLFRGNTEEDIRRKILSTRCIKGIISLPANLFYGTGIPACIILIDKENAAGRTGIFFLDAGEGFRKDGSKNRLREQDIERIVRVFKAGQEIDGYSRFVPYSEILGENAGNLNVPRYIRKPDDELPHDIAAHLAGGIPQRDIESLAKLWEVSPELKGKIFAGTSINPDEIAATILADEYISAQRRKECGKFFSLWREEVRPVMMALTNDKVEPKELIRELGEKLLNAYSESVFADKFDVFDCLMNYWNAKVQDDVYMIKSSGWESGRAVEVETVKGKIRAWDGVVIPREVMEREYYPERVSELKRLAEESAELAGELDAVREEYDGREDEEIPDEVQKELTAKGKRQKGVERKIRELRVELDGLVMKKYPELTEGEIRHLVFDVKWMGYLHRQVIDEFSRSFGWYTSRVEEIARRYERPLVEIDEGVRASRELVREALGRMGYSW